MGGARGGVALDVLDRGQPGPGGPGQVGHGRAVEVGPTSVEGRRIVGRRGHQVLEPGHVPVLDDLRIGVDVDGDVADVALQRHDALDHQDIRPVDAQRVVDDVIALVGVDGHVERRLAGPGRGDEAVEVVEVIAGSPADDAGLRPEDLVVAVDGLPVRGVDDLHRLMTEDRIGVTSDVEIVRQGALAHVRLTPRELATAE